MADKITAPDVIESGKIVEEIAKVEQAFVDLLAQMKLLTNQSVSFNTQGQGNQILSQRVKLETEATAAIKERARLQNAVLRQEARNAQATSAAAKALQKERLETSLLNREQKEDAILKSNIVGAYRKLNLERSKASKTLRDLVASEKASNDEIIKAQANFDKLDAKVRKADAAVRDSTKNVGNYKSAFKGIKGVLTGLFGAFGVVEGLRLGVQFAKDSVELAKQAKGVEFAFNQLGDAGEDAFDKIKIATRGALSDLDIKTSINQFRQFGIPLERANTLFEFLAVSSSQTGKNIKDLQSSLVEGLSKESLLRIDNLGISALELNKELEKTPVFVDAVANIAEKKLANAGNILDEAANSTQIWNASWENLKTNTGKALSEIKLVGVAAKIIQNMADTQEALNAVNKDGYDILETLTVKINSFTESGRKANRQLVIEAKERLKVTEAINEQQKAYVALNGSLAPFEENTKSAFDSLDLSGPIRDVNFLNTSISDLNEKLLETPPGDEVKVIQDAIQGLEKERDAILSNNEAKKGAKKLIRGTIAFYQDLINKEKEYQTTEAITAISIQESNFKILEYQESIDKLIGAREKLNKLDITSIGSTAELQKEFEKISKPFADAGFEPVFELDTNGAISELERFNNARINGEEAYTQLLKDQADERANILNGVFGEFENLYGIDASAFSNLIDSKKNDFESFADAATQLNNLIFNVGEQNRQADLDSQRNILDQVLNNEKKSEEQKLAAQIRFNKEEAKIKKQSFKAQKVASLTQIAIDTATAIVKATSQTGVLAPAFIPSIIAIGAIQAAIVASQKAPQFFKGTENAPRGWAWTDEKGPELITDRSGNIKSYGSNDGPTLRWLDGGEKIITAEKTKEIFKEKQYAYQNVLMSGQKERVEFKSRMGDNRLINEITSLKKEIRRLGDRTINVDNRVSIETPITRY